MRDQSGDAGGYANQDIISTHPKTTAAVLEWYAANELYSSSQGDTSEAQIEFSNPCFRSLFLPTLIVNLTGDLYTEDGLTKSCGPH